MAIEEAIYSRLSGYSPLSALVGARIYPSKLPQDVTFPALCYLKISETSEHIFGGDIEARTARIQVSAFADNYYGVKNISKQIKAALRRYAGTIGTVTIEDILIEGGEMDLYEPETGIHHIPIDASVIYKET